MSPCRPPPALVLAWPPVLPLAIWLSDAGAPPISDVRLVRFASCPHGACMLMYVSCIFVTNTQNLFILIYTVMYT